VGEETRFRRKVQMKTRRGITLCYLRSQSIKLLGWCLVYVLWSRQLPFANRVHHFHACNRTPRRPKRLEAQRGTSEPFHCSMILLHDIVEILAVADNNGGLVSLIIARNGCRIRATLINGGLLREPLGANGLA